MSCPKLANILPQSTPEPLALTSPPCAPVIAENSVGDIAFGPTASPAEYGTDPPPPFTRTPPLRPPPPT